MKKTTLTISIFVAMLALGAGGVNRADPMGTAFTYQGFLTTATGMDYSKLTPLLVEAVKALKIKADEREKQHAEKDVIIERLQEENQALSKRLAAIESLVEQLAGEGKELNNEGF